MAAVALGVRLSLPEVEIQTAAVADTEFDSPAASGATDAGFPAAAPDTAPAAPTGGSDGDDAADLTPLKAEEARFTEILTAVVARLGISGDNPDIGILISELEQMWDDGEPTAGLVISVLMENPDFGFYDPANARLWLERASDGGSLMAGSLLALRLLEGDPSQPGYDPERAVSLMEDLHAQGVFDISGFLLQTYAGGQAENGYLGDPARAQEIAASILTSGHGLSLLQLGGVYRDGFGGEQSQALAVNAYLLAGENGAGEGFAVAASMMLDCDGSAVYDADGAAEAMLQQIERYGDSAEHRRTLAIAYAQAGRWAEAIAEQERAIVIMRADSNIVSETPIEDARAVLERYQQYQLAEGDRCA
ncbi:MAG: SEL1-like repeat protein [Planctomycetota bacterium]